MDDDEEEKKHPSCERKPTPVSPKVLLGETQPSLG